jgi:hypothetical protein
MLQTDQKQSFPQTEDSSTHALSTNQVQPGGSSSQSSTGKPEPAAESPARERRRRRIELVEEFGGHSADLRLAVDKAIERGMYSPRTNRGDIESSLMRTWAHRHRNYNR